jgi:hypothetical protein
MVNVDGGNISDEVYSGATLVITKFGTNDFYGK